MTVDALCRALVRADSEEEVVALLEESGYWSDQRLWRYLGDTENNYGPIGNQQSESVAALIEKLVNSVDARLMDACRQHGMDPDSSSAPRGMREAVATFFENHQGRWPDDAGSIANWPDSKATREADLLTLTATGHMPRSGSGLPCLSIADAGEGQTPDNFPSTFLSLNRSNKLRVQFVQGKFNMGATGALQFCSPRYRLQLIVSRRNPEFLEHPTERDLEWGFTVVRREPPQDGSRSSVFTYLAPLGVSEGRDGDVLSFTADEWPIFPEVDRNSRDAYGRMSSHGTLVKLYEYSLEGTKSNIVRSGGGLLQRVDFGMPELALPIRLYECRQGYRGHSGSFSTNVLGIVGRLDRDRLDKLEDGFPVGHIERIENLEVRILAYALRDNAVEYRSGRNAIAFTVNGQTHATKSMDFFTRRSVGMSQLSDSLIVIVDCTNIRGQSREDLFMNSRDRLRSTAISARLEESIERFLRNNPDLRALKNRRREQEIADRLNDAKPLAQALSDLVKHTPSLSQLLRGGHAIPSPFPKGGPTEGASSRAFVGRRFPTYFRFRNLRDGEMLRRSVNIGSTTQLRFETDAQNDYFHREVERGSYTAQIHASHGWQELSDHSLTGPTSGIARLSFDLPQAVTVGDQIELRLSVTDPSRTDPFKLEAQLQVLGPSTPSSGNGDADENRNNGSGQGTSAGGVAIPSIVRVHKADWHRHDFDELSALKITGQGLGSDGLAAYDFYVNCDNKHLLTAQKDPRRDPEALDAQFVYSLVLFSMALLIDEQTKSTVEVPPLAAEEQMEAMIAVITRRLAPFVLPTLDAIGTLDDQM